MEKRSKHADLPLHLVYDILIKLPVKTLHRLHCVCKPWCSLISDPPFQKDYYSRRRPVYLHVDTEDDSNDIITLSFSTYNHRLSLISHFSKRVPKTDEQMNYGISKKISYKVIQSCKELVCLASLCGHILLCNPSTEELIAVPLPQPVSYEYCLGFGYAASTDEFKVVRFFSPETDDEDVLCEVLTFGTGDGWREARSPPPYAPRSGPILFQGALHLMPEFKIGVELLGDHYIAAFDLGTEQYREVPFPQIYFEKARSLTNKYVHLAEFLGSLCMTFDFSETDKITELWFLKDYHNGKWVKEYSIDLSTITSHVSASPVGMLGDGRIWLYIREDNNGQHLRYYNAKKKNLSRRIEWTRGYTPYVESFMSLGSRCPPYDINMLYL